jgi:hypothetical protein
MSEKPISPLRRRMIEDMTVRNFVEKTRNDYIRHVRTFTAFLASLGHGIVRQRPDHHERTRLYPAKFALNLRLNP